MVQRTDHVLSPVLSGAPNDNFRKIICSEDRKLTRFLTTFISTTSFKVGLKALFCIPLKRLEQIFLKSLHVIFIMYIIRSETFIEIDSLQDLKISRQTYPTKLSKICVTIFTVLTLC